MSHGAVQKIKVASFFLEHGVVVFNSIEIIASS